MSQVVLLVDDNCKVRSALKQTIEGLGLSVIEAVDGLDGLKKASESKVDICLIDNKMPIMDGLTLIKNLLEDDRYAQCKIVLMTTVHCDDLVLEAKKLGIEQVLKKPIASDVLSELLKYPQQQEIA